MGSIKQFITHRLQRHRTQTRPYQVLEHAVTSAETSVRPSDKTRKHLHVQFCGAADSRRRHGKRRGGDLRERGMALLAAMTAITILAVMLTDLHENTSTHFAVAQSEGERLRAEYMAVSAINLTRLLVANEPAIRQLLTPLYQGFVGKAPPQIPVWKYASDVLSPFCAYSKERIAETFGAMALSQIQGLDDLNATCEILGASESGKINVNKAQRLFGDPARLATATQLFPLFGGYQIPSPYDPLFERRGEGGQINTRMDVIANIVDWWDFDQERTTYDPTAAKILSAGAENDLYRGYKDKYAIKNAPLDSLEELRLIAGVDEDFWATFVQPDPARPDKDLVTIYGSGAINPNEANPEVMLARVCGQLTAQPLCADPLESSKFVQLLRTVRSMFPVPWFSTGEDFLNFLEGKGEGTGLFAILSSFMGANNPLMFRPITITQPQRQALSTAFQTDAQVFTIQATGASGDSRIRIRSVINFDKRWVPPPPNSGIMPPLGVVYYWRVD